jgi:hypothetical protein
MLVAGKAIRMVEKEGKRGPTVAIELKGSKSVELDIIFKIVEGLAVGAGGYLVREFARYLRRRKKTVDEKRKEKPGTSEHITIKWRSEEWITIEGEYSKDEE